MFFWLFSKHQVIVYVKYQPQVKHRCDNISSAPPASEKFMQHVDIYIR